MKVTYEVAFVAPVFNRDGGFAILLRNLEWPVLHVTLDVRVGEFTTNETLRVEDRVLRV